MNRASKKRALTFQTGWSDIETTSLELDEQAMLIRAYRYRRVVAGRYQTLLPREIK